jgi:hypothetical protein
MVVRRFPDNSVVCHARRLAGLDQGVFVSGGVLGVHCNSPSVSFFPDIYNDDWFFFAEEAATRRLPCVGDARQKDYDPFQNSDRARQEEFGDLLAEGLYALAHQENADARFFKRLEAATTSYWLRFIDARREVLAETMTRLDHHPAHHRVIAAIASLRAAERQLETITPDICLGFLDAWQADLADWQKFSNGINVVGNTGAAMDFLNLNAWTQVGVPY